jgi:ribosomal-protein-alanine N-acetyltransferase
MSTKLENIHIPTDITLKTERMILRYPKLNDAERIFASIQSPKFPEQLPLKEMAALSEIETWIKALQENWHKNRVFSWVMESQKTGGLLGQVTLAKKEENDVWALAFWTDPEKWGAGYATEGAERITRFGFDDLGAKKIWAGAGVWNKGSCRVLEKLGMKYICNNPKGYYAKGKAIETREYEISVVA